MKMKKYADTVSKMKKMANLFHPVHAREVRDMFIWHVFGDGREWY
jgi:hypothetical protein